MYLVMVMKSYYHQLGGVPTNWVPFQEFPVISKGHRTFITYLRLYQDLLFEDTTLHFWEPIHVTFVTSKTRRAGVENSTIGYAIHAQCGMPLGSRQTRGILQGPT